MAKLGAHLFIEAHEAIELRARESGRSLEAVCMEASADYDSAGNQKPVRRFLFRYGALSATRKTKLNDDRLARLVSQAVEQTGALQARVLSTWMVFSGAVPGVESLAFCHEEPQCEDCPLRPKCRYQERSPTIRELPESERPRERLFREGEDALSDAELLAIIIRDGRPGKTAVDIARMLLHRAGSLRALATRTIAELCEVEGVGPAKAAQIKAALTVGRRMAEAEAFQRGEPVSSSESVFRRYHAQLRDSMREVFKTVLLDRKNRVISDEIVSIGSLSASIVHPREVLNPAVRQSAAAIICVHNHPSGDPQPSKEDLEITKRLREACKVMGISLLDHIIIGDDRYFSFADEGLIKE